MKLSHKKKIALVLSGGGIKAAAFHIGACLALKEKGFRFAGGTKEEVSAKYIQLYELITGKKLIKSLETNLLSRIEKNVMSYISTNNI